MSRIIKDPEERRRELIDTAERLFLAEGYEETAISDIVREVNVSQGAFYYYFDSKEDVLIAVIEKQIAQMESDFIQIAKKDDLDEAAKLNSMVNRFLCISASRKKILGFINQSKNATLHMKLMRVKPFARIAPVMAEVITKGCNKGRFHVERPLETSYLLLVLTASANHMFYESDRFANSNNADQSDRKLLENMRVAMEDLLGRALGVSDYRFILQI
ncbi:MAG: TetR/AcrR family transcriptional regulator [Methanothrix sp.]|jgi:AcrR family transcriptional regulator|nr:TetR/AcrR family transcriptional regulator [Methanothrix sp.]